MADSGESSQSLMSATAASKLADIPGSSGSVELVQTKKIVKYVLTIHTLLQSKACLEGGGGLLHGKRHRRIFTSFAASDHLCSKQTESTKNVL